MKSRFIALSLLALMLVLVGAIPIVRAQSGGPARPMPPEKPRTLADTQWPSADAREPQIETTPVVDPLRVERHPGEQETLARSHAGSTIPALPDPSAPPTAYPSPEPGTIVQRASIDALGMDANNSSNNPDVANDGRFVAFESYADNLVQGDWNELYDIFVRDLETNTIERVSVSSVGSEGNSDSYEPSISADGRFVAFTSYADNLTAGDANGNADVFVHDRQTGATTLVSRHSDGTPGNWGSYGPSISADGRYVAFHSYAGNLVDDDTNGSSDVFVHDRQTGATVMISRHSDGTPGNWDSYQPAISADSQFVAFESYADNLVDDDTNNSTDVFVYNVSTGATIMVSRHSDGTPGNSISYAAAISGDGQIIAFESYADNLVDDDANGSTDVFVHNLNTGATTMVSRHSDGTPAVWESYSPDVSANGRYVVFFSYADNLIDADENGTISDVFRHDRQTGVTTLVSHAANGAPGNWYSYEATISADGATIAYRSHASNLIPFDWNSYTGDIFVRLTGQANLHTISGQVVDENNDGVGWVRVRDISGAMAETDENGYYSLTSLLPGDHGVWVDESYYYIFPMTPQPVTLPPDAIGVDIAGVINPYYEYWYTPVADAYVDQANKSANYGTKPYVRVKNASADMNAYFQFDVNDLPLCAGVGWAGLSLYATDPSPDGGTVYEVANNWTETGIKWNNAPALGQGYGGFGWLSDETYNWAWTGNVWRNDVYSFAVRNDSSDQAQYDSREGANPPWLYVSWYQLPERMPDAQYGYNNASSGLAPMTVQFTDQSDGCPTSWEWDFGDGATSTAQNPTHTFANPGYYPVTLTVTNSQGIDKKTYWFEVIEPPELYYLSLAKKTTIGGLTIEPADIVLYDKNANIWTMVYDGSAMGTPKNIAAFAFDSGDLLLTFGANQSIAGLGTATPYDVVRFTPDDPWTYPLDSGAYSWYLQGKLNGLTKGGEKIDAITIEYGDMLTSMSGSAQLPTNPVLNVADEDLAVWRPWAPGWADWLEIDGSQIPGMANEDVSGVWYDDWSGDYYVTIAGKFNLGSVAGNDANIVRLTWQGGTLTPSLVDWLAPGVVFKGKIDAIELAR